MFGLDLSTSLIGIFFLIVLIALEYANLVTIKSIIFKIILTSVIQCMYIAIYISGLYLDNNLNIYLGLILLVVLYTTAFVIYKWEVKLSYWLTLNFIISPVLSFALIQLDTSVFDTPFGGITEGYTPIASVICSLVLQVTIWLLVKLHKWVRSSKK